MYNVNKKSVKFWLCNTVTTQDRLLKIQRPFYDTAAVLAMVDWSGVKKWKASQSPAGPHLTPTPHCTQTCDESFKLNLKSRCNFIRQEYPSIWVCRQWPISVTITFKHSNIASCCASIDQLFPIRSSPALSVLTMPDNRPIRRNPALKPPRRQHLKTTSTSSEFLLSIISLQCRLFSQLAARSVEYFQRKHATAAGREQTTDNYSSLAGTNVAHCTTKNCLKKSRLWTPSLLYFYWNDLIWIVFINCWKTRDSEVTREEGVACVTRYSCWKCWVWGDGWRWRRD